ncbi:expressed unknown protein [Seminavis robusta]|uniref:Uncharacterized protein n=1 Tax=Seminavis robusta TaxID=568900 RepID=A0A9N8HS90_9STRA|nr:expressed unknown protein [Seminavis robusta]|eukprot:Sro1359_g265940.1 n/a (201) ;mRNA; r:6704-7306
MMTPNEDQDGYALITGENGIAPNQPLPHASRNFKISSVSVGLLIGFLVQEATLAANVVILEVWGNEFAHTSRKEIVLFSLLWSFVTSAIAIILLGFLRSLITAFYQTLPMDGRTQQQTENIHKNMLESLEVLFVVGALIGVSFAWVITDLFLGMQPQINFSIITLGLALLWCKIVVSCRAQTEELEEEETGSQEKPLLVV